MNIENTTRWLWGAAAIAKHINRTERQTRHLLSLGKLPAKKIGVHYVADPAALDAYLRGHHAASMQRGTADQI